MKIKSEQWNVILILTVNLLGEQQTSGVTTVMFPVIIRAMMALTYQGISIWLANDLGL